MNGTAARDDRRSGGTERPSGMRIFLIAGEESGDRLGASLMAAIEGLASGPVTFFGVGGSAMAECGLRSLFPLDELAINGFSAIPARLPRILRRIREAADAVIAAKPDVLVIIDSPDFTHRVARRVRAGAPHIPIVDYVSPTVWAWRPGLPLPSASARAGGGHAAAVAAGSRAPCGRTAVAAGAARQPWRRDPAAPCGLRGRGRPRWGAPG